MTMGTSQGPPPSAGQPGAAQPGVAQRNAGSRMLTAVGYVVLFVLGALQGLIGSFQYSKAPAPLIAILLVLIIFATCVGCGWGVGSFGAAVLPAVGWLLASFILAMPRPNGSVVITATAAGEWYLYGGAIACAAGCVGAFFARLRRSIRPR